ncbi:hypothetical protein GCM10010341_56570 [Streptomyces noursei]|nr:hypothetical protein GCM10010341_56570 [Streptomyces noursei]
MPTPDGTPGTRPTRAVTVTSTSASTSTVTFVPTPTPTFSFLALPSHPLLFNSLDLAETVVRHAR